MAFAVSLYITFYETYVRTELLHATSGSPSNRLRPTQHIEFAESVWVRSNTSSQTASLDRWVMTTVLVLWNIVWLKLFWDIWSLLLDSKTF
jgi:hypothetical protein